MRSRKPFINKHVPAQPKHDVRCEYCNRQAERVTGKAIYPHRPDLHQKSFWRCQPCAAYVGCHPGTWTPLGRLANAALRRAKSAAHAAFDPLWKTKRMSRSDAYGWLAAELGISKANCHIGMFDLETCQRVVSVCAARAEA